MTPPDISPDEAHEWMNGPLEDRIPKWCPACAEEREVYDEQTICPVCNTGPLEEL